jgi:hypothetical protein
VIGIPLVGGVAGQARVTAIAGDVITGHVAEAAFVTLAPVQASAPVARTEVVTLQTFNGAVKVPE